MTFLENVNALTSKQPRDEVNPARVGAAALWADATPQVDAAAGESWYEQMGNPVDRAVGTLCLLRRAAAGDRGGPTAGDEAVRAALESADPAAVVWLASRLISCLDEQGFPETASLVVREVR